MLRSGSCELNKDLSPFHFYTFILRNRCQGIQLHLSDYICEFCATFSDVSMYLYIHSSMDGAVYIHILSKITSEIRKDLA